jgi:phosphoribosylformimino-5-aminoimidazole carboxamide ribotide isomerase
MTVYPAVDLRGGRCVRLLQGDPGREERFPGDPVAVACGWVRAGARALHVVDLDGAFAGRPEQLPILRRIAPAAGVPVQWGGGLRTEEDVAAAFAAGAARVVVGTRALDAAFLSALVRRWGPERVVGGLDARGDRVAVEGWRTTSALGLGEAAALLWAAGVREAVFTQVVRDGMLGGPDLDGLRTVTAAGLAAIASGGVSSEDDLRRLRAVPGCSGAILGRALYAGRITLQAALAAAEGDGSA